MAGRKKVSRAAPKSGAPSGGGDAGASQAPADPKDATPAKVSTSSADAPMTDAPVRRNFTPNWAVRRDGKTFGPEGAIDLTEAEYNKFAASGLVDGGWGAGDLVEDPRPE
ncbi:MAG: hypothetical protein ACK5NN_00225 [Sphingomonadaceae bacterium]